MDSNEFRVLIKHYFLRGKSAKVTKEKLDKYYDTSAPPKSTVIYWFAEFKRGRTDTIDEHRSGRPKQVTTPEMIKKVSDIVSADSRVKVRDIADKLKISTGTAELILHEHLHMKKLSARWVPRLLTINHKSNRALISSQCLSMFQGNPEEFLRRFITVDETWIHHHTPETKQQSKQWVKDGSSAPKKAKVVPSAGKIMATVFWDAKGVILVDYLKSQKTITGAYYVGLLDKLNLAIQKKRPHLARKKVLFHQDNAPAHTSLKTKAKLDELGYELLPHPPYSPDLAPSDYFLFPDLKKWLGGKRFTSNEEVEWETNAYFEGLEKSYYKSGLMKLEKRWTKCIDLKGDYVEK